MSVVALPARVAPVVDIAVLLLAAIGVVGTSRPALGTVDVKVALVPVNHTDSPSVDTLAGCPVDGTGTVKRSHI
jgi:hypothetical protein